MMGGAGLGSQEDGVSLSQAAGVALAPGQPPPWGRRGGGSSETGSFRGIAWEVTRRSALYFIMVRN